MSDAKAPEKTRGSAPRKTKAVASKGRPALKESDLLSLQRAFETFQRQSEMLESSHADLKGRLEAAQLDLAEKNARLAKTVADLDCMKRRLSGIVESISDAVMTIGADGRIRPENDSARKFLDDLRVSPSNNLKAAPDLRAALARTRDGVFEAKTPSGRRRYILSAILMKEGGEASELVVTLKDITELMELQERVGREDRMAALGRVAASVAHEIRNPLAAIEGFGVLLERDLKESPAQLRLASKTVYAARQLNSVVSNLLSYTREVHVDLQPLSAAALISNAVEFVKPIASDRKAEISLAEIDPSLIVVADQRQITQVLINVVQNAVEACPHRGGGVVRVACSLSENGQKAVVEVSDNGPGVPASLKKRIFEPFFTTKDGGTGLGLSLCQRIVEAHGGAIAESGEEGHGARFSIELKASGAPK